MPELQTVHEDHPTTYYRFDRKAINDPTTLEFPVRKVRPNNDIDFERPGYQLPPIKSRLAAITAALEDSGFDEQQLSSLHKLYTLEFVIPRIGGDGSELNGQTETTTIERALRDENILRRQGRLSAIITALLQLRVNVPTLVVADGAPPAPPLVAPPVAVAGPSIANRLAALVPALPAMPAIPVASMASAVGSAAIATGSALGNAAIATGSALGNAAIATGSAIPPTASAIGSAIGTAANVTGSAIGTAANVTGSAIGTTASTVAQTTSRVGSAIGSAAQRAAQYLPAMPTRQQLSTFAQQFNGVTAPEMMSLFLLSVYDDQQGEVDYDDISSDDEELDIDIEDRTQDPIVPPQAMDDEDAVAAQLFGFNVDPEPPHFDDEKGHPNTPPRQIDIQPPPMSDWSKKLGAQFQKFKDDPNTADPQAIIDLLAEKNYGIYALDDVDPAVAAWLRQQVQANQVIERIPELAPQATPPQQRNIPAMREETPDEWYDPDDYIQPAPQPPVQAPEPPQTQPAPTEQAPEPPQEQVQQRTRPQRPPEDQRRQPNREIDPNDPVYQIWMDRMNNVLDIFERNPDLLDPQHVIDILAEGDMDIWDIEDIFPELADWILDAYVDNRADLRSPEDIYAMQYTFTQQVLDDMAANVVPPPPEEKKQEDIDPDLQTGWEMFLWSFGRNPDNVTLEQIEDMMSLVDYLEDDLRLNEPDLYRHYKKLKKQQKQKSKKKRKQVDTDVVQDTTNRSPPPSPPPATGTRLSDIRQQLDQLDDPIPPQEQQPDTEESIRRRQQLESIPESKHTKIQKMAKVLDTLPPNVAPMPPTREQVDRSIRMNAAPIMSSDESRPSDYIPLMVPTNEVSIGEGYKREAAISELLKDHEFQQLINLRPSDIPTGEEEERKHEERVREAYDDYLQQRQLLLFEEDQIDAEVARLFPADAPKQRLEPEIEIGTEMAPQPYRQRQRAEPEPSIPQQTEEETYDSDFEINLSDLPEIPTADDLVNMWGNLDNMLDNLDNISVDEAQELIDSIEEDFGIIVKEAGEERRMLEGEIQDEIDKLIAEEKEEKETVPASPPKTKSRSKRSSPQTKKKSQDKKTPIQSKPEDNATNLSPEDRDIARRLDFEDMDSEDTDLSSEDNDDDLRIRREQRLLSPRLPPTPTEPPVQPYRRAQRVPYNELDLTLSRDMRRQYQPNRPEYWSTPPPPQPQPQQQQDPVEIHHYHYRTITHRQNIITHHLFQYDNVPAGPVSVPPSAPVPAASNVNVRPPSPPPAVPQEPAYAPQSPPEQIQDPVILARGDSAPPPYNPLAQVVDEMQESQQRFVSEARERQTGKKRRQLEEDEDEQKAATLPKKKQKQMTKEQIEEEEKKKAELTGKKRKKREYKATPPAKKKRPTRVTDIDKARLKMHLLKAKRLIDRRLKRIKEKKKKAEEAAALRRAEEEAIKKKKEEEAAALKKAEEEALKKKKEAEEAKARRLARKRREPLPDIPQQVQPDNDDNDEEKKQEAPPPQTQSLSPSKKRRRLREKHGSLIEDLHRALRALPVTESTYDDASAIVPIPAFNPSHNIEFDTDDTDIGREMSKWMKRKLRNFNIDDPLSSRQRMRFHPNLPLILHDENQRTHIDYDNERILIRKNPDANDPENAIQLLFGIRDDIRMLMSNTNPSPIQLMELMKKFGYYEWINLRSDENPNGYQTPKFDIPEIPNITKFLPMSDLTKIRKIADQLHNHFLKYGYQHWNILDSTIPANVMTALWRDMFEKENIDKFIKTQYQEECWKFASNATDIVKVIAHLPANDLETNHIKLFLSIAKDWRLKKDNNMKMTVPEKNLKNNRGVNNLRKYYLPTYLVKFLNKLEALEGFAERYKLSYLPRTNPNHKQDAVRWINKLRALLDTTKREQQILYNNRYTAIKNR